MSNQYTNKFNAKSVKAERLYEGPTGQFLITYEGEDWDGLHRVIQEKATTIDEAIKRLRQLLEGAVKYEMEKEALAPQS